MATPVPYGDVDGFDEAEWKTGFHPTLKRPIPSMQCVAAVRSGPRAGERCNQRALLGASVCIAHGGHLPPVREKAAAIVESARLKLIGHADEAVEWLVDLGRNASSEAVRLGAAREVLDRAGAKTPQEIDVKVTQGESPADVLKSRLAKLRETNSLSSRVIDGELAGDDDEATGDTVALTDPVPPEETS